MAHHINPNGSMTILDHKLAVTISASTVTFETYWCGLIGKPWIPTPRTCWSCGVDAMYKVESRRRGEELVIIYFECGNCGETDTDAID